LAIAFAFSNFGAIHIKPPLIASTSSPIMLKDSTMASHDSEPIPIAFMSQTTKHQRAPSFELSTSPSEKQQLQMDQPCDYSVVCGRGKHSFNHSGNKRFRILASMFIETYSEADSKAAKSAIVSKILKVIRQAGGHFCKYENGSWFDVGDHSAREKVSALLRDLLHTQYRSSAKSKLDRRHKSVRKQKPNQNQSSGQTQVEIKESEDSDDSSTTSSCWGTSKDSLGFEYWLEESDDYFDIDVF
jgi:hypothetical protein